MSLQVNAVGAICSKCGTGYSRYKGYFPVSYAVLHKGIGHVPVCRRCIDAMYDEYLSKCNDPKLAVRQVCRKVDLYWNEGIFEQVFKKSTIRSMMTDYIQRTTSTKYAGKSYDDTLLDEGTLWNFETSQYTDENKNTTNNNKADNFHQDFESSLEEYGISDEVAAFWGAGYTPAMLADLEQRRSYWMSKLPKDIEVGIGTEAIIRQICSLELDINRDRAAGRAVDRSITALNTLLGSACLKPAQQKDETDSEVERTPFGVWIRRWEDQRPLPEVDPELRDVDGIIKYILTWFYGHLTKMIGIKNTRSKLYEQEIEKLRVDHPEFEDDSDDDFLYDVFDSTANEETPGDAT